MSTDPIAGDEPDQSADAPLLDLLDALVDDRGRVAAAEALGVNYRTMMTCYDSRRVSRRMRQALVDFRDAGGGGDQLGVVDRDVTTEDEDESLEQRVAALEEENLKLRETFQSQAGQLDELGRRVAVLEGREGGSGGTEVSGGNDGQQREWRPPRRGYGLPYAGVVTLEEQPDEAHAFGPAAPLVAEWRELQVRVEKADSRVDRDRDEARR